MLHPYLVRRIGAATDLRTFYPKELAQIYNLPANVNPHERVPVCVVSFGGGLYGDLSSDGTLTNGDVQAYWRSQGIADQDMPIVRVVLLGDSKNQPESDEGATVENTIDVETIGAVLPASIITLIIASNTQNAFLEVLQTAKNLHPLVVSCSWGFSESSDPTWAKTLNTELQALATAGINVCAAAGDNGSRDGTSGPVADFPASSPWCVALGGSRLVARNNHYDPTTQESVWNDNPTSSATGGGVSKIFGKPSYQSHITVGSGRLVPDLALDADPQTGVTFLVNGQLETVGGTSICAPFFAAYLGLIRCKTFVNPLLYAAPNQCFHDIISGNNGDFRAGPGFDLCTGRGSIDGTLLQAALLGTAPAPVVTALRLLPCIPVHGTLALGVVVEPVINVPITWTSSVPTVADVQGGIITGRSSGSTVITAVANDSGHVSVSLVVLVV